MDVVRTELDLQVEIYRDGRCTLCLCAVKASVEAGI